MAQKPDPLQPETCSVKLAALAAPARLGIVWLLRAGPLNVTEIAARLEADPVNVSHHLGVLVAAGLACREKRGRFAFYSLAPGVFLPGDDGSSRVDLGCCRLEFPPGPTE